MCTNNKNAQRLLLQSPTPPIMHDDCVAVKVQVIPSEQQSPSLYFSQLQSPRRSSPTNDNIRLKKQNNNIMPFKKYYTVTAT